MNLQELLAKNARIRAEREKKHEEEQIVEACPCKKPEEKPEEPLHEEEEKKVEIKTESKKGKKKSKPVVHEDEKIEIPEKRAYMVTEDVEKVNEEIPEEVTEEVIPEEKEIVEPSNGETCDF